MVYISGEEMTRYAMELIMEKWVKPSVDISKWEFYDLSCKDHRSIHSVARRELLWEPGI